MTQSAVDRAQATADSTVFTDRRGNGPGGRVRTAVSKPGERKWVWITRLALVLVGLLTPLIGLEIALRVFGPILPGNYETGVWIRNHPVYGRFHVPSSSSWVRAPEFTSYLRFNSLGLRGPDVSVEKPAGAARLVLLGDSFVEAQHVWESETQGSRLQALLRGAGRPDIEVLSMGVSGWGPSEQYVYLQEAGVYLRPDLVILSFYIGNDISNSFPPSERERRNLRSPTFVMGADGRLESLAWSPRPDRAAHPLVEAWRERLVLVRAFETGVLDKLYYQQAGEDAQISLRRLDIYRNREPAAVAQAWRVIDGLLGEIQGEVERSGARLMIMVIPSKWQVYRDEWAAFLAQQRIENDDRWDLERPNRRLARVAAARGLPVVDLLPAMSSAAADGERLYFREDIHWTRRGHAVGSQTLAEYLRTSGLLPPQRP